jgi:hypothetical protein
MALYIEGDVVAYMRAGLEKIGTITEVYEDTDNEDDIPAYDIVCRNGDLHVEVYEDDILDIHEENIVNTPATPIETNENQPRMRTVGTDELRQALDASIWGFVNPRDPVPIPREEVTLIDVNAENFANLGLSPNDYTPSRDSTRHCIITLTNGLRLTPRRVIGGGYIFRDDNRTIWVNEFQDHNMRLYATHRDVAGVMWATADDQLNFVRNGGAVKKEKKKLRRKYPMPEIKQSKYYDDSKYIA